jgi:hypothetical protein
MLLREIISSLKTVEIDVQLDCRREIPIGSNLEVA